MCVHVCVCMCVCVYVCVCVHAHVSCCFHQCLTAPPACVYLCVCCASHSSLVSLPTVFILLNTRYIHARSRAHIHTQAHMDKFANAHTISHTHTHTRHTHSSNTRLSIPSHLGGRKAATPSSCCSGGVPKGAVQSSKVGSILSQAFVICCSSA